MDIRYLKSDDSRMDSSFRVIFWMMISAAETLEK